MIIKKIIIIVIFLITILLFQNSFTLANVNESDYVEKGSAFLQKAISNENPELNSIYLNKAKYFYYVASKNIPPSSEALIGLGRVYMLQDKQTEAKNTLFMAYSTDTYNANASFYLAEYFYQYDEFIDALKYYENAQKLGFEDTFKNTEMIKKCKSKLGIEQE